MFLLHQMINLLESIIGELDAILLHINLGSYIESEIMKIFLEHDETEQFRRQLDQLARRILQGRAAVKASSWEGLL